MSRHTCDEDALDEARWMSDELDAPEIEDEPNISADICPACNGSGEGQYDGTKCSSCGGRGEA
jgi:hypothetical protein